MAFSLHRVEKWHVARDRKSGLLVDLDELYEAISPTKRGRSEIIDQHVNLRMASEEHIRFEGSSFQAILTVRLGRHVI